MPVVVEYRRKSGNYFTVELNTKKGDAKVAIIDNKGYVKPTMAGLRALSVTPSTALAESKFLSLFPIP